MFARPLLALLCWLSLASPIAAPAALAPALWVARDGDTTIWLFGTVHQLRQGTPWLTGAVAKAFADSDVLTLEIAPVTDDAMAESLVKVAPVKPAPLPPDLDRRLRKRAHDLGFPAQAFDATDPWFAATTLAAQPLARAGYSPAPAPEALLARLADRSGTTIEPLETIEKQIAIFAALPQPAQRTMLARVLDDPEPVAAMDRIVATWGKGNVATLDRLLASDLDAAGPSVRTALLERRNAAWARTIGRWMRQPGTRFVAVGAGHLAGPDSVRARLQAMGVEVRRVR